MKIIFGGRILEKVDKSGARQRRVHHEDLRDIRVFVADF
jgi:hypothetical protein